MYARLLKLPRGHSFFLFGPRLTGKSTLLQETFSIKDTLFLDLLKPPVFQKYLAEPETLEREIQAGKNKYKHVVMDEVQRVPALLDVAHHLMGSSIGREIQFIMSGSSARKLKRSKANLLGGRAWSLELFPLSCDELSDDFILEKALSVGTLPKIYALQEEDAHQYLRAYVETYLAEEIKAEALTRNLGAFMRFLPRAADENGHLINFSALSREVGVDYKTIQEYFQILEDTLIGFWLEPYGKTVRRKLAKHPKFYFFDTGVLRALTKTLKVPVERRTAAFGNLFENFFISELRRLNSYHRLDFKFCFYRTDAGAEVDLIIQRPGKPALALEIKATVRPSSSDCSGLMSFTEILPNAELAIVCLIDEPQLFRFGKRNVRAYPWRECLKMLAS